MRLSARYIMVTVCILILFTGMLIHARHLQSSADAGRKQRSALVAEQLLTDLCIVTEARYTRHLVMADYHAAFQDHPAALEHFPSGSFFAPPVYKGYHVPID